MVWTFIDVVHSRMNKNEGLRLHMAADTLGHLLALHVTPASDDRSHVGHTAEAIQAATDENVNPSAMARRGLAGG